MVRVKQCVVLQLVLFATRCVVLQLLTALVSECHRVTGSSKRLGGREPRSEALDPLETSRALDSGSSTQRSGDLPRAIGRPKCSQSKNGTPHICKGGKWMRPKDSLEANRKVLKTAFEPSARNPLPCWKEGNQPGFVNGFLLSVEGWDRWLLLLLPAA